MGKNVTQIWFKHKTGSLKRIPGVVNHEELCPKMKVVPDYAVPGQKPRQVLKADMDHVVKLTLLNEDVNVRLTDREKSFAEPVQNSILARRAAEADAVIQANDLLRSQLRALERDGEIEVVEWDKSVDVESLDARESVITELSPIAIADYEARGIPIPDHLKTRSSAAVAETNKVDTRSLPKGSK